MSSKSSSSAYDKEFRTIQRRTLLILYLTYGSFYLSRKADSMVKSALHDQENFTVEQLAMSDTTYLLVYTFSLGFSGVVGNYLPSNVLLACGLVGIAFTSFLKSQVTSPIAFACCQALHALAQSTGWPTCIKLIGTFVTENRGFVMGIWTTCQSLGGILGAVWATAFISKESWTGAYLYHIPIQISLACVVYMFIVDEAKVPVALKEDQAELNQNDDTEKEKGLQGNPTLKQVLGIPGVIPIGVAYFHLKFLRYALLMWLPYYYEEGLNFSQATAGYMSSSFEMGGLVGTPLIGFLSDKAMRGKRDLTSAWFMGGAAVMILACIAVSHGGAFINAVCMVIVGILVIGPDSVLSGTIAQDLGSQSSLGNKSIGAVAGLINSVGSCGSIFQSYATALISEKYGWRFLFSIFVVCAAICSFILFRVAESNMKLVSPGPIWLTSRRRNVGLMFLGFFAFVFGCIAWTNEQAGASSSTEA